LGHDNGTIGYISFKNNLLNLTAYFPDASSHQAVSIYRSISVPFRSNPVAISVVRVSSGIHYGMRFSGIDQGVPFDAWYEGSPLQHRLGQGANETLIEGLSTDAFFANGSFPSQNATITRVKFYVESIAGQSGWFSLILSSLKIVQTDVNQYADNGSYNGLIIHLNSSFDPYPLNLSLFQTYAGFRINGTQDLQYRLYYNYGLEVKAEGFTYHLHLTSLPDYEFAVLLPEDVKDFPIVYSPMNASYISVVALQGHISSFRLDTLLFDFTSQPIVVAGDVDNGSAQFLQGYYFVFLFVTPIALAMLFRKAFKDEQETGGHS